MKKRRIAETNFQSTVKSTLKYILIARPLLFLQGDVNSIRTRRKCWKAWNETEVEREFCTFKKRWKINYDLYTGWWCIHLISYCSTSLRMSRWRRTCTVPPNVDASSWITVCVRNLTGTELRSQRIPEGLWYFLPAIRNKISVFLSTIVLPSVLILPSMEKGRELMDIKTQLVVLTLLPSSAKGPWTMSPRQVTRFYICQIRQFNCTWFRDLETAVAVHGWAWGEKTDF